VNDQASLSHEDRAFAAVAYLLDLTPIGLLGAVVIILVNGREARFVGVHATQAILALLAVRLVVRMGPALALLPLSVAAPLAAASSIAAAIAPLIAATWLGFSSLRGSHAALPGLGHWSERIVDRSRTA
jgi:uncharacterized membrane protein